MRHTGLRPSGSVLIKQSDSLCPLQFLPGAHPAASSSLSRSSAAESGFRPESSAGHNRRAPSRDLRASTGLNQSFLKLRIRLADFPCLHCSLSARGLAVGDLMRLIGTHSMHSDCQEPARIFTGRPDARRTRPEQVALFGRAANCFSERLASAVGFFFNHTKKRELFPGLGSSSPSAATRRRSDPARTPGPISRVEARESVLDSLSGRRLYETARFTALAGRPRRGYTRSIAGLAEPCSSSAFEVSLECLLLPPRSARPAAPAALACDLLRYRPACLLVQRAFSRT